MAIKLSASLAVLFLSAFAIFTGCGSEPAPVCRVQGKVLVAGKPAGELFLRFQSLSDPALRTLPDAACTEPDGTFSLVVKSPGEYGLTAVWPVVTLVDGERVEGNDRLRGRYNDLQRPIQKLTVALGDNIVPDIHLP